MRWRFWRRRDAADSDADRAVAASGERLREAQSQGPAVSELVAELRRARKLNRFGARFDAAFREHR